ncbi:uncharacterized protein EI90DRAFT_3293745 [Cantharellus anzutake]|uniref:uncharacterized protein n=1 Tax=Cantharellus anzutake TaxID=1750568 RepID=UPI0019052244|nr:uncharacterized protein EI90DRAFT_3293745 [Cantharellus anzutake]KAF8316204.1 hypothetical protein EI90DRAFT_3293745 [Cantharellus anzutake]
MAYLFMRRRDSCVPNFVTMDVPQRHLELESRRPFDSFQVPSDIQTLHEELAEKDAQIQQLKGQVVTIARLKHVSKADSLPKRQSQNPKTKVSPFLTARILLTTLSAESCWDSERRWDNAFMQEGHLREFLEWPRMSETIKNSIGEPTIHQTIHQAAGRMRRAIRFQMNSPGNIALVFPFWRPDHNCELHSCDGAVQLRGTPDGRRRYPIDPLLIHMQEGEPKHWMFRSCYILRTLGVILFAGKLPEMDNAKNVIKSCWDISAPNCTAKVYNIREVTPGLIALAAVSAWRVLLPPEDRHQDEDRFHFWRKCLIMAIGAEKKYAKGRPMPFHETMSQMNEWLFGQASGQSGNEKLEQVPVSQVTDLGAKSNLLLEHEFFAEFKAAVMTEETELETEAGGTPDQLSNDANSNNSNSHGTLAAVVTENAATCPAVEPPIGSTATTAGATPATLAESVPSGTLPVAQGKQKRKRNTQKSQAKGSVRKSRRVSGPVGDTNIPISDIALALPTQNSAQNAKRLTPQNLKQHEAACRVNQTRDQVRQRMMDEDRQRLYDAIERSKGSVLLSSGMHRTPGTGDLLEDFEIFECPSGSLDATIAIQTADASMPESSVPAAEAHQDSFPTHPNLDAVKIFVRTHPKARMATSLLLSAAPTPVMSNFEAFHPFATKEDLEFTDICIRNNIKNEQHARIPNSPITLKNHRELFQILDQASNASTTFETVTVEHRLQTLYRKVKVLCKSIFNWVMELLRDPFICPSVHWYPEQQYSQHPDGSWVRRIGEPWTGDDFWAAWDAIPESTNGIENCLLGIYIYADKSKLSSFGSVNGYPVIARLANLPRSMRNSRGVGGGCLVGWLPDLHPNGSESCDSHWAEFQAQIYQRAMSEILRSLCRPGAYGQNIVCADGVMRRIFPFIFGLIADNQEIWSMLAMRGGHSIMPCPICLIPRDMLSRLDLVFERRTKVQSRNVINAAATMASKGGAEELLKSQGLRSHEVNFALSVVGSTHGPKSAFSTVPNCDPHWAVTFDVLHTWLEGVWGDHMFAMIRGVVPLLGRDIVGRFETTLSSLPRWKGLKSFPSGILSQSFNDGTTKDHVLRVILHAMHALNPNLIRLIHCVRNMAVINILFQCEILDDDRISRGHAALQELQQLTQGELVPATLIARSEDLREKMRSKRASDGQKSWSFPKFHILLHHSFSSFTAKGVPANSSTKPNEKEHKFFRDTFHAGNFKNTAERVTIQTQRVQILDLIRQDIEHSTTSTSDPSTVALEGPVNSAILRTNYGLHNIDGSKANWVILRHYYKIRYRSFDDGSWGEEFVRTNKTFHGRHRDDAVVMGDLSSSVRFAQVHALLEISAGLSQDLIALVSDFHMASLSEYTAQDRATGFLLFQLDNAENSHFVPVTDFTWRAFLAPTSDRQRPRHYLLNDVIDTDMFFRLKGYHPSACNIAGPSDN